MAAGVLVFVAKTREESGLANFQFFRKSVHCVLHSVGGQSFTDFVAQLHHQRVPVLVCRAVQSAAVQ